jgi:uncharacterized protein YqcC (DUF446 family)
MNDLELLKNSIKNKVQIVETEMKRIGYWCTDESVVIESTDIEKSNLSLEKWIQYIYLNSLKVFIDTLSLDKLLPYRIGLLAFRNYDYMSYVPEAEKLVEMLNDLESEVIDFVTSIDKDKDDPKIKWFIEIKKERDFIKGK